MRAEVVIEEHSAQNAWKLASQLKLPLPLSQICQHLPRSRSMHVWIFHDPLKNKPFDISSPITIQFYHPKALFIIVSLGSPFFTIHYLVPVWWNFWNYKLVDLIKCVIINWLKFSPLQPILSYIMLVLVHLLSYFTFFLLKF